MQKMSKMKIIKEYFSIPGKPVTFAELKALTSTQRQELAEGAAKELGVEIEDVISR